MDFRMRNVTEDETSYVYRFSVVCLGKTVEFGVPYKDLSTLRAKGQTLLAMAGGLKNKLGSRKTQLRKRTKASASTQASRKRRSPKPAAQ